MGDLYSINVRLMEVQRVTSAYRLDISNKREDVERLNQALSSLESNKSDFHESKEICVEPAFTKETFHGENAKDIEKFRAEVLEESFLQIPEKQISDAEDKIREQIKMIEQEITGLNSSISSLDSERTRLLARKAEVKSES